MNIAVLTKFLPRTLVKIKSPVNGEISVVEQFGQRKIIIGGLTQSGPMAEEVWKEGIKEIIRRRAEVGTKIFSGTKPDAGVPSALSSLKNFVPPRAPKILILGLGGGSLVKLLNHSFPPAKITGVEIDSLMIELGKKYLELENAKNLEIKIGDARNYLLSAIRHTLAYDLIFVDMYQGDQVPEFSEHEFFLKNLRNILSENGTVVFNRLYYKNHIFEAKKFLDKLKKIFNDLESKRVLTNLLIYAKNS